MDQQALQSIVLQALEYAKQQGADAADAVISEERGFSVSSRKSLLEEIEYHQEQGFAISVFQDQRTASVSTTELTKAEIFKVIDKAMSIVAFSGEDPYAGLPDRSRLAFEYPDLNLYHQWDLTTDRAAEMAIECDTIGRQQDPRITDSEGSNVSTYSGLRIYGNTEGFVGGYQSSRHSVSCSLVAKEGDDRERDYEYTTARCAADLEDVETIAKRAAAKVIKRLKPRQIKTQSCPVIFHSSEAKGLWGALIGAISGGNLYRHNSFLCETLGNKIFPDFISVYQQPHLQQAMGSRPFDHEGVETKYQHYINQGILENYVLSSYSARRLKMQSTGNAGGVFNLTITPSDLSFDHLLKEMGTGLLVTEQIGQGVRLISGDYSRGAAGYWVEDGEIQYPVSEITIASNLRDMFANIKAVANDVDTRGNVRTGSVWIEQMNVAGTS